jgi:DNA-binding IclR family transcriptional regulator
MASRPDAELRLVWGAGGVRTCHLTLEALAADLEEVRRLGWAEDRTPSAGSFSVAAPVRGVDGDVTAALSLAPGFVTASNDVCNHAKLAVAAASRISEAMRGAAIAV